MSFELFVAVTLTLGALALAAARLARAAREEDAEASELAADALGLLDFIRPDDFEAVLERAADAGKLAAIEARLIALAQRARRSGYPDLVVRAAEQLDELRAFRARREVARSVLRRLARGGSGGTPPALAVRS